MGKDADAPNAVIVMRGEQLEIVSQFKYLGSMFTSDSMLDTDCSSGCEC